MRPDNKNKKSSIVLVSDPDTDCRKLLQALSESGHTVVRAEITEKSPAASGEPDLVVWHQPGKDSLPRKDLKRLRASYSCTELLILTDSDLLEDEIKSQDIIIAAPSAEKIHLLNTVNRAIRYGHLKRELENLRSQVAMSFGFDNLIGISEPVMALRETIARVSPTDITIAITGPGGSGKRLIAKTIHHHSNRRFAALISVDCAALTAATIETELFGAGSVTSALKRADGGTLLINEINFMPQPVQLRLAEFLKDYRLPQPDGATGEKIDLRLIVTGDDDLDSMVRKDALRTELLQHLNVYPIAVPALRERTEDIESLVDYFLRRISTQLSCGPLTITHQALQKLYAHSWPGNIRELENALQRAAGLCRNGQIDDADIRFVGFMEIGNQTAEPVRKMTLKGRQGLLADNQKTVIAKALEENDWNFTQTAQKLGIGRTTLWRKVKKYNLARETVES
jgi:two-component system response regulator HydG